MISKERIFGSLLVLIALVLCLPITEIGLRWIFKDDGLPIHRDARNLNYRYDEKLGWFPIPNSRKIYTRTRSVSIDNNQRGFRDAEHLIQNKPRILFLGDSFVWGFDVEKLERFTDKLAAMLPDWSIYNLGVSGYGTDQQFLLLQQEYDFYRPSVVFLLFCADNDRDDNASNVRYGGYYKPYFIADGERLQLRGVPVPQSEDYFFSTHDQWAQFYC